MRKGVVGLSIIGYYFPTRWREFVHRGYDGDWWLHLVHPNSQAVKPLRVVMASKDADLSGFIGLEAEPHGLEPIDGQPAFFVTTATGDLRRNENGELLGDQLFCAYPPPDLETAHLPTLAFALPAPPYQAPPGKTAIVPEEELPAETSLGPNPGSPPDSA